MAKLRTEGDVVREKMESQDLPFTDPQMTEEQLERHPGMREILSTWRQRNIARRREQRQEEDVEAAMTSPAGSAESFPLEEEEDIEAIPFSEETVQEEPTRRVPFFRQADPLPYERGFHGSPYIGGIHSRNIQRNKDRAVDFANKGTLMAAYMGEQNLAQVQAELVALGMQDPTQEALQDYLANLSREQLTGSLRDEMRGVFEESPEEFKAMAPAYADAVKKVDEELSGDKRAETAFVNVFASTFDQEVRDKQIANLLMRKSLQKLTADTGVWETMVNYGGLLLSDVSIDASRAKGVDFFTSAEDMKRKIANFKSQDAATQLVMWEELKEEAMRITDENEIKAADHLMKFLDPSAEMDTELEHALDKAFLALDASILGLPLARIFAAIKRTSNAVRVAKELENTEAAAQMNVAALQDPSLAKMVGIDQVEAVLNSLPFRQGMNMPLDKKAYQAEIISKFKTGAEKNEEAFGWNFSDIHVAGETEDGFELRYKIDGVENVKVHQYPVDEFLTGHTGEIHQETQKQLFALRNSVQEVMRDVVQDDRNLRQSILSPKEKEVVQQRVLEGLEKSAKINNRKFNWIVDDFQIANQTDTGFDIHYRVDGQRTTHTYTYRLSDKTGRFENLDEGGLIKSFLGSASYYLRRLDEGLVTSATRLETASGKMRADLNRALDLAVSPLGSRFNILGKRRKQLAEVDGVLRYGDEYINADGSVGKVFTPKELREGLVIPTKDGNATTVYLDDKQRQVYYALRDIEDYLFVLKNNTDRRRYELQGFKDLLFDGKNHMVREVSDRGLDDVQEVFDLRLADGKGELRTDLSVAQLKKLKKDLSEEFTIISFREPKMLQEGVATKYAIVPNHLIDDLPLIVNHYKPGYVTKIRKDANYFIKEEVRGRLNGVDNALTGERTLRIAGTKIEAERALQKMLAENPELDAKAIRIRSDRELSRIQLEKDPLGSSGGLYTSPRASHEILHGIDGREAERVDAITSLQRQIDHLSVHVPRNEWRLGYQQKWMDTVNAHPSVMRPVMRFTDEIAMPDGPAKISLEKARNYINDQLRIPSASEQQASTAIASLGDWAGLKGFEKTALMLHEGSSLDLYGTIRSGAFHSLLGWFNPAQLFVQAQGASIALSLHPEFFIKSSWEALSLRALMNVRDPRVIRDVAKRLKMDEDDLVDMVAQWRRTGLQDSIRATADHAAAESGYSLGWQAFKNVADKGLFFYKNGELWTRSYAWLTARNKWLKANPGKKINTAAEKAILDDAIDLTLNMFRSNRAAWQKGALSVPTQFLQIQAKFMEAIWPKFLGGKSKLTGQQQMRLMAMQTLIYGGAGVPFGKWLLNNAEQMMGDGAEIHEESEVWKKYKKGGLFDASLFYMFGADVDIGKRGAIVSGIEDMLHSMVFDDVPFVEAFAGAAGEMPKRIKEALGKIYPIVAGIVATEEGRENWTHEEFLYALGELGRVTSTWRNIDKAALMWSAHKVFSKRGNSIIDRSQTGGFNLATELMVLLGFTPTEVTDTYTLAQFNKNRETHLTKRADAIINIFNSYLNKVDHEGAARMANVGIQIILGGMGPHDREIVLRRAKARIDNPTSVQEKELKKFFSTLSEDIYGPGFFQVAPGDVQLISQEYHESLNDDLIKFLKEHE